jgi:2,3-bisphosphoglycerate-independent phosphoglycerate mutase
MKYVVLLGDGMADDPQPERGDKTPLELASTPSLDLIANRGTLGLAATVPAGMEPGSDVANMTILGYEPDKYYAGRATIEAAALGIRLAPGEAALRMNLVTLAGDGGDVVMADYSGGHPGPDEQARILETLTAEFGGPPVRLVPGVSFRNLCIVSDFTGSPRLAPPHDHAGERIADLAPGGPGSELIADLQARARRVLAGHPVNRERKKRGKPPINGVWFWGLGRAVDMPSFKERHGKSGAVVTGVDLIRGLARLLDLEIVPVEGATGYVDTNFEGKARAVLEALERVDFVFLHVEAPDESGHEGDLDLKIRAIEDFDRRCVKLVLEGLRAFGGYRVLLMPDHETPVRDRGHRGGPVPFAIADKQELEQGASHGRVFSEKCARETGAEPVDASHLLASLLFV